MNLSFKNQKIENTIKRIKLLNNYDDEKAILELIRGWERERLRDEYLSTKNESRSVTYNIFYEDKFIYSKSPTWARRGKE